MLKNCLAVVIATLICLQGLFAQDSIPVQWKVDSKRIETGKYELQFTATIPKGVQLFAPNQLLLDTKTTEIVFADSAIAAPDSFQLVNQPRTIRSAIFEGADVKVYENTATLKAIVQFPGNAPEKLKGDLKFSYGNDANLEFYPATAFPFSIPLEGGVASSIRIRIPSIDIKHPIADCGDTINQKGGLMMAFLLGLLGGLVALLTPCMFPMIPLTVSFFTKQNQSRKRGITNAILYGFFIFLIYVLLTLPFHIAGKTNPEIFNNISTSVVLNLIFFAIFIAFALSFFGLYEIGLPSSVANKMNEKAGIGTIGGIFFMALTLAIVSFSCTGPVFGTFLVSVLDGGPWPLTMAAAGFGVALGLPFALFALFPRWLQSIPKSGGWMTEVKVVLGLVELALAFKFLANADNVRQWGFMKREIFIGIWEIIAVITVLYLVGIIGKRKVKYGITRLFFILLFAAAAVYLVPGVTNTKAARLKLISGFPPPSCYSIYKNPVNCDRPLLDYEEALILARKYNKPVLIDFTGWACVNCRKMEEKVWTNSKVEKLMKEDFILVSLYVDERTALPPAMRTVYTTKSGVEKTINTVGERWTNFQIDNFEATSQPQYAIVTPDEKALVRTKFYTPSPGEFAAWLECAKQAYKEYSKK